MQNLALGMDTDVANWLALSLSAELQEPLGLEDLPTR